MLSMKERMIRGMTYRGDEELWEDMRRVRRLLRTYNNTGEDEFEYRTQLLKEMLGSIGEHIYIEPNFRCDYGSQITIGNHFYANFDCVILDVCPVTIGNHVLLGPQVGIYTPSHPIDARVRADMLEYGSPVTIGDDVWIGGHAVINGGVEIGSGSIIGSGSVVTKSIPAGVIAVGNPCRVIREITQEDAAYWQKQRAELEQAAGLPR
ncbi:sugar O-acetyltransferase [Faecalispora jeddahensis]|uniref:sugar O-acetyltransferase n=1 Tax=Faecalispora jeddahensis TaxID=1414721 RepID=UPI001897C56B|nr:sugar O-acetyltransferase [Faecalispora jeddahensis]